jgi:hypothetical protein
VAGSGVAAAGAVGAGAVPGGAAAVAARVVPHSPQKRSSALTGAAHAGHDALSGVPQLRQKRLPEAFSIPHAAQITQR